MVGAKGEIKIIVSTIKTAAVVTREGESVLIDENEMAVVVTEGEKRLTAGTEAIEKLVSGMIVEIMGGVVGSGEVDCLEEVIVEGKEKKLLVASAIDEKNLAIGSEGMRKRKVSGENRPVF